MRILLIILFLLFFGNVFSQENISKLLEKAEQAKGNLPGQISVYYKVLSIDSVNYEALLGMGKAYYSRWKILGRIDEIYLDSALILFTKACNSSNSDYRSYLERGTYYYEFHELDKAFDDLSYVIKEKKDLSHVYWKRGTIYMTRKDYKNATEDLTSAINLSKLENSFLYRMRSTCYCKLEDYGKCKNDIKEALRIAPKENDNILYMGDYYAIMGDYKKALKNYNYILSRNDKYSIAYLKRGNVYAALNDLEKAEKDWRIALSNGIDVSESRKNIFFGMY